MRGLRRHEGRPHHVGIFVEVALPEIVGGRDRADVEHLLPRGDRRQRVARRRQHAADQHVHLVRQDELVGLGDAGVRPALIVLDDQVDLGAAEHALVLVQIHLEAVLHVDAELREDAGLRRDEADAKLLRLSERRAPRHTAACRRQQAARTSTSCDGSCCPPVDRGRSIPASPVRTVAAYRCSNATIAGFAGGSPAVACQPICAGIGPRPPAHNAKPRPLGRGLRPRARPARQLQNLQGGKSRLYTGCLRNASLP